MIGRTVPPRGSRMAKMSSLTRQSADNGSAPAAPENNDASSDTSEKNMQGSVNMFSTFKTSEHENSRSILMDAPYNLKADYAFPPRSNEMNYIPFDQKDADDFTFENETNKNAIDNGLPTRIVCQNPGKWEVVNQYQLDCLRTSRAKPHGNPGAEDHLPANDTGIEGPHQLSGFATLGNKKDGDSEPLPNSSATCTVERKGDKVVLVIAYTVDLKQDDYFKVGAISSDASVAICNSYPGASKLVDPICITLCNKLQ